MTGSCVPVLQEKFVNGRVVATPVADLQVTAIDKARDILADGAVGDTQALRERRLQREARASFLVEHLADDEGQPQLLSRCFRVDVDLIKTGENEAGEIGAVGDATLAGRCRVLYICDHSCGTSNAASAE
jgi:hypothetical protein